MIKAIAILYRDGFYTYGLMRTCIYNAVFVYTVTVLIDLGGRV